MGLINNPISLLNALTLVGRCVRNKQIMMKVIRHVIYGKRVVKYRNIGRLTYHADSMIDI